MKLYKRGPTIWIEIDGSFYHTTQDWDKLVNRTNLFEKISSELHLFERTGLPQSPEKFDPPIGSQEVWAAGVTYYRSREARMEESKDTGGGSFYDRVYQAERPELFLKSMPYRVSGHGGDIHIRRDSDWNVPEPELTLFVASSGSIEGYTVGNDVSSRSIEGENPLYLPQAKTYQFSAALGPCLLVRKDPLSAETMIAMKILRNEAIIYQDEVSISRMKRSHEELVAYLTREIDFPYGCYLMTGTGIVPPDDFSLLPGDLVSITIDGIGTLTSQTKVR
jgi:2-dehydro-3-deoxy-D-arabinonate dehydratase